MWAVAFGCWFCHCFLLEGGSAEPDGAATKKSPSVGNRGSAAVCVLRGFVSDPVIFGSCFPFQGKSTRERQERPRVFRKNSVDQNKNGCFVFT